MARTRKEASGVDPDRNSSRRCIPRAVDVGIATFADPLAPPTAEALGEGCHRRWVMSPATKEAV
jgi:hypothetical protein